MDRYSAVTDTRFDCRIDRPSCEDMVVCRDIGWKDDDEEVEALEALEAGWSIVATDICDYCNRTRVPDRAGCRWWLSLCSFYLDQQTGSDDASTNGVRGQGQWIKE